MAWTCHRVPPNSPISDKNRKAKKQNTFSMISPIAIAIANILQYNALPVLPRGWPIPPRGGLFWPGDGLVGLRSHFLPPTLDRSWIPGLPI